MEPFDAAASALGSKSENIFNQVSGSRDGTPLSNRREAPDTGSRTARTSGSPSSLGILVVEDNPIDRKIMSRVLSKYGCCNVQIVENGALAVENVIARSENYDVIFMGMCAGRRGDSPLSTHTPYLLFHCPHFII
jgi:hypothetical protein